MLDTLQHGFDCGLHGSAALVPQDNEQWCAQMRSCVLQAAHHFRGNYISGDAYDEQLSEISIEEHRRWHPRVAASQNCCVGLLAFRQVSQSLLADRGESC